jgi:hypothetical protein
VPDRDADVAASEVLGNAAIQAGMGQGTGWDEGGLLASLASEMAQGGPGATVAAALRLTPRAPDEHARLIAILEGSSLQRRDELVQRLNGDQASALAVEAAVREHLGELTEAARSEVAHAFARATGDREADVAAEVHAATGAQSPGVAALTALCASILARAPHLDEEEEPLGVDYGTEESGM